MRNPVHIFAIATLAPVILLVLAALLGGVWVWLALGYMTVFVFALDALVAIVSDPADPECEFPAANRLSITLALAHFVLLGLAIWVVSGGSGLGVGERFGLFFAFGLFFGQVSNSNAHELIHRPQRTCFELGKWVYISLLFGHHTSAHRLVHHRYVGSARDPNSALLGESYYRFARRAWWGSFRAGMRAEAALERDGVRMQPYVVYVGGALVFLAIAAQIGGLGGVLAYAGFGFYATAQLLMSDYVQHYGLRREQDENGRLEPVASRHSWNSPHWFSSLLMLNAPRHSDHHNHPARIYPALELPQDVPMLPRSLPVMGFVALFPKWWRRMMDARVDRVTSR